jgi:hypothetical protein
MNIQVNIAVQRNRVHVVNQMLKSFEKQTVKPNCITLILQGFKHEFRSSLQLNVIQNHSNKGASERFNYLNDGVNLIIDDDFIPSYKYIETALNGHLSHPNALCSFWGFDYLHNQKYTASWLNMPSWNLYKEDIQCKRIGLGLSIFDKSKIDNRIFEFEKENYNDMQVAVNALKYGVELWKIKHNSIIAQHQGDARVQSSALWKGEKNNLEFLQTKHDLIFNHYEATKLLPLKIVRLAHH